MCCFKSNIKKKNLFYFPILKNYCKEILRNRNTGAGLLCCCCIAPWSSCFAILCYHIAKPTANSHKYMKIELLNINLYLDANNLYGCAMSQYSINWWKIVLNVYGFAVAIFT